MAERVLVCGGRDYTDEAVIFGTLDRLQAETPIALVIAGAASGADHMATNWAKLRAVDLREYPADWKKWGKAAGALRNQQMLEEGCPTVVVAFPGGRGTSDMKRRALAARVRLVEVSRPADSNFPVQLPLL